MRYNYALCCSAGRNDDPLLFVKVLHRQLAVLSAANSAAVGRLFSAIDVLASFAKDTSSGIVADDLDLFCKLQSELQRNRGAAAAAAVCGGGDAVENKIAGSNEG
jgi:hypothetical protein